MSKFLESLQSQLEYQNWCHNRRGYGDCSKEIRALKDLIYAYEQGRAVVGNQPNRGVQA